MHHASSHLGITQQAKVVVTALLAATLACSAPTAPRRGGSRIINAENSTFVGTPKEIVEFIGLLRGGGAAIVNLTGSRFIITTTAPSRKDSSQAEQ